MLTSTIDAYATSLDKALLTRTPRKPLTEESPSMTIDDAYQVSLKFLEKRLERGEKVIGKKIGVTSKAVQDMLNVRQPDFGFLTNTMRLPSCSLDGTHATHIDLTSLIQPRCEGEVAFILGKDLPMENVQEHHVLEATDALCPCFEIVDSRIADWAIKIQDTIADNASCGVFVLGEERFSPKGVDCAQVKMEFYRNQKHVASGKGAAVQGNPLTAVAWLANTLGARGTRLQKHDIILSGSLVPLVEMEKGDTFRIKLSGMSADGSGVCEISLKCRT